MYNYRMVKILQMKLVWMVLLNYDHNYWDLQGMSDVYITSNLCESAILLPNKLNWQLEVHNIRHNIG